MRSYRKHCDCPCWTTLVDSGAAEVGSAGGHSLQLWPAPYPPTPDPPSLAAPSQTISDHLIPSHTNSYHTVFMLPRFAIQEPEDICICIFIFIVALTSSTSPPPRIICNTARSFCGAWLKANPVFRHNRLSHLPAAGDERLPVDSDSSARLPVLELSKSREVEAAHALGFARAVIVIRACAALSAVCLSRAIPSLAAAFHCS